MSSDILDPAVIDAALGQGLHWQHVEGALMKVRKGRDFADALAYVNTVGALAEDVNHHPDIDIRWNVVTLRLCTHSAGGITRADLDLAARIDALDQGDSPQ